MEKFSLHGELDPAQDAGARNEGFFASIREKKMSEDVDHLGSQESEG